MSEQKRIQQILLPFIICGLGTSFVIYEFIIQVSPSVMTAELMRDLNIKAAALGTISAFYYYAYSPMQIPAGMLYDRWGPRKLITSAILVCALGAMFFSITNSLTLAATGRFLTGMGSAFSYIGALVLIAKWFPPRYFAMGSGFVQLTTCVGAITGQVPLAHVTSLIGWRNTLLWVSFIGFFFAMIIWIVVRDGPEHYRKAITPKPKKQQEKLGRAEWQNLKAVCKKSQMWWLLLFSCCSWSPAVVFAGLWGIPYLTTAYHVSPTQASSAVMLVWIAVAIGSPLIGWISDKIGRRLLPFIVSSAIGLIASVLLLISPHHSWLTICILLFFFGLGGSAQALSFAFAKDLNKLKHVGVAMGVNNMAVVSGGALLQPIVGIVLQAKWHGQLLNGSPIYDPSAYREAFIILPLCFAVGLLVSIFKLKETYCKPQHQHHVLRQR